MECMELAEMRSLASLWPSPCLLPCSRNHDYLRSGHQVQWWVTERNYVEAMKGPTAAESARWSLGQQRRSF